MFSLTCEPARASLLSLSFTAGSSTCRDFSYQHSISCMTFTINVFYLGLSALLRQLELIERLRLTRKFSYCINCMLLFCPFDSPLVKPLQQFPTSYRQKKDKNTLLNGLYFPFSIFTSLPSSRQKIDTILSTVRAVTRKRRAELTHC